MIRESRILLADRARRPSDSPFALRRFETELISTPPSLDDLSRDPSLVRDLPARTLEAIVIKCAALQSAAAVALAEAAERSKKDDGGDRLLSVEEAADKLSVSKDWVYRRGKKLGLAVPLATGTLRYSNKAIEQHIERRRSPAKAPRTRAASTGLDKADSLIA
jgi:predicted DNA-binding transcriptional regulator AlpA